MEPWSSAHLHRLPVLPMEHGSSQSRFFYRQIPGKETIRMTFQHVNLVSSFHFGILPRLWHKMNIICCHCEPLTDLSSISSSRPTFTKLASNTLLLSFWQKIVKACKNHDTGTLKIHIWYIKKGMVTHYGDIISKQIEKLMLAKNKKTI